MTPDAAQPSPRPRRASARLPRLIQRLGLNEEYVLVLVSILIGATTSVFADLFFRLIEYAHEAAYGHDHKGDFFGPFGLYNHRIWMLVALPALGALATGLIVRYFAREAKGHGVPEVMDAMYRKGAMIRPRVAAAKAVSSALTIGSGGSAGTEGPIIQIGAAIASSFGQYLQIPKRQMSVVVACGVSAGIGAIFNAPIAGVLFALEIFLKDFSFRTFSPVVFSSVISCSIMHALRGEDVALFEVRALREGGYFFVASELPFFLVLGVICAIAATAFTKSLYYTEDLSDRLALWEPLKPVLGALGLGLSGVAYVWVCGTQEMPRFFGNGYPAIEAVISGDVLEMTVVFLLALFALKLLATCLTLGMGGSGGVFAPSLMMGGCIGGAFGLGLHTAGWIPDQGVSAYALVGMAAVVAGTTHAPLTAIVILYEITREPKVILPVMFAAIIATAGAQLLLRDSIYTLKLRRRGVRIGSFSDLTILRRITVEEVDRLPVQFFKSADPLQELIDHAGDTEAVDFVVIDDHGVYLGMVAGRDVRTALLEPESVSLLLVGELMRPTVPTVTPRETLDVVLNKFARHDLDSLPVVSTDDESRVVGLLSRKAVIQHYQAELDRRS